MKIYILRHGEAAEHGDPRYKENERPLTAKGIQRTKQLAEYLEDLEIGFDRILSSPLIRARQTAEIVAGKLRKPVELTDALTPSGSMKDLVDQIAGLRPVPESVALVGHEPYLSGFISLLCIGSPDLPIKLKKGALCRLDVERVISGRCATLEWLIQPRLLG
ncbi:MAG TPA: phosphohistidine phosphatase SixA [Verrucomicrobiae bacterium]|nr:phosphohistidine phosphatase SixA [Verrucomicrobiae bacterium]